MSPVPSAGAPPPPDSRPPSDTSPSGVPHTGPPGPAAELAARVPELLEAMRSVGSRLELRPTLDRICETAAALTGARYAAIGVEDADGTGLTDFVFHGVDEETARRIGRLPDGRRGLLGALIRTPEPVRLADLTADPRSCGFPPHHPRMRGILGVPIRVRGGIFGNLYLTEKEGGQPFTDYDLRLVRVLATEAGIAVGNVRLYEAARQRERWIDGSVAVTTALLSGGDVDDALQVVAEQARTLSGAAAGFVLLPADEGGLEVVAVAADGTEAGTGPLDGTSTGPLEGTSTGPLADTSFAGPPHTGTGGLAGEGTGAARVWEDTSGTAPHADPAAPGSPEAPAGAGAPGAPGIPHRLPGLAPPPGTVLPPESRVVAELLAGRAVFTDDAARDPRLVTEFAHDFGPAMLLPLRCDGRVLGALVTPRRRGGRPFGPSDRTLAAQFAAQAALALATAEAQRDRERLAVFQDRDRIARDLHDLVIKRLFAAGMTLERARSASAVPEVREGVGRAVDALDVTIQEIRAAVFALGREPDRGPEGPEGLRARVLREVAAAAVPLGFRPACRLAGPVDSAVDEETGAHLVAALREALSNAFRHARARRIEVVVDAEAVLADGRSAVRLTVADDGVGVPEGGRRSGLRNLARRAESLGGGTRLGPGIGPNGTGTTLTWQAPLT